MESDYESTDYGDWPMIDSEFCFKPAVRQGLNVTHGHIHTMAPTEKAQKLCSIVAWHSVCTRRLGVELPRKIPYEQVE